MNRKKREGKREEMFGSRWGEKGNDLESLSICFVSFPLFFLLFLPFFFSCLFFNSFVLTPRWQCDEGCRGTEMKTKSKRTGQRKRGDRCLTLAPRFVVCKTKLGVCWVCSGQSERRIAFSGATFSSDGGTADGK